MAYFFLSRNGEESLNKLLSPDPERDSDHLRGESNHMYTRSGVKK